MTLARENRNRLVQEVCPAQSIFSAALGQVAADPAKIAWADGDVVAREIYGTA